MAWWRKAGMESAHGGSLQRVKVASRNRVGGHKASSLSQGRAKLTIWVGGNRASSLSLWLQRVGVLEWLGNLC